jgi:EAL domain-containing protein (putative c-di-GMP-specific phosphodiesterase class I)
VDETTSNPIVSGIIAMAHALGNIVVVEAVETRPQLEFVRIQGADRVQGFFTGRPVPPEDFQRFALATLRSSEATSLRSTSSADSRPPGQT